MDISSTINKAKRAITAQSPVLLAGTAVVGIISTAILSARAGYKARTYIDAVEIEKGESISTAEKVGLTWLCYIPATIAATAATASVVGAHVIHNKRNAALAGLYAVGMAKLDDYQEKAEELLGPKKSQETRDDVAQKAYERGPDAHEVVIVGDGTDLAYDEWSGRVLKDTSVATIENVVNIVNRHLLDGDDVSVNEVYDHLGLGPVMAGEGMGWSGATIEAKFGTVMTPNGKPAISFWFRPAPKIKFGRG